MSSPCVSPAVLVIYENFVKIKNWVEHPFITSHPVLVVKCYLPAEAANSAEAKSFIFEQFD